MMKISARRHAVFFLALVYLFFSDETRAQTPNYDQTAPGYLVFHPIQTDSAGFIRSWAARAPAAAFDSVINATWHFWKNMRRDDNGLPYYMNHQVWRPINDPRGVGGDQFAMALSSLYLLYTYTGDESVRQNISFIADYYVSHSLSAPNAAWPNLPFPYNTLINSGYYDGDMILGRDITQPDKAGSFGFELLRLYKMTGNEQYLHHAILIANTLAEHTVAGSDTASPFPFKVNAYTGKTAMLKAGSHGEPAKSSSYTTNFGRTIELWLALITLQKGNPTQYQHAVQQVIRWLKTYPLKTNKWGPFFEDIPGWSDTQINAISIGTLMMEHLDLFPEWRSQVPAIFDWVYARLGNKTWETYGVMAVNEQTAYQVPGNSHTSRQAAAELEYGMETGDTSRRQAAIRQLLWATYCVNTDGKNCYPRDEVWMTDGYGDYIRHYLRAMAFDPDLAPAGADHLLWSESVVSRIYYRKGLAESDLRAGIRVKYETFDAGSTETFRLARKPGRIMAGSIALPENNSSVDGGWEWKALDAGDGILKIHHVRQRQIIIYQ